jgi:hypothetical protein
MIKFKFKRTNQEAKPLYRSPAPAVGGSTGSTDRMVPPKLTPTRAASNASGRTGFHVDSDNASDTGDSDPCWNQPKGLIVWASFLAFDFFLLDFYN